MKYKKEFQAWYVEHGKRGVESCQAGWEACEKFLRSRKCKTCKYALPNERCSRESLNGVLADFCCRYWVPKKGKK